MRNLCQRVLGLGLIGMWLGASAPAQAASGVGPYYATPSWDQTLPAATRFIDLTNMPGAVLDRETGLVWEKTPSSIVFTWFNASFHCINLNTGDRTGWRLPAIPELLSLVDRSAPPPTLPSGHPFTVQSSFYWSASTSASSTAIVRGVLLSNGQVAGGDRSDTGRAWCVRGGPGVDAQ